MSVFVPVTRPECRSCSITRPRWVTSGTLQPDKGVRVSGGREDGLHFGQAHGGRPDFADIGRAGEANLGEGLDGPTGFGVVDDHRVAGDDTGFLEAVDPALDRRGGQSDPFADIPERSPGVFLEQSDDGPIQGIELRVVLTDCCCVTERHDAILLHIG